MTNAETANARKLQGHCPMGCGQTLFAGSGGYITCSLIGCPNPCAVADILEDREPEHVVLIDAEGFTVRHPLRERLGDELMTCSLHAWITARPGPPAELGRYRVVWRGDGDTALWLAVPHA